jgi:uncharacterized protein
MTEELQRLINTIVSIAEPDKVILFGSRARGNARDDSDYDFLIVKKGIKQKRRLARSLYERITGISVPVDLLVADQEAFEEKKDNPYYVYYAAHREGEVVYDRS